MFKKNLTSINMACVTA